MKNNGRLGILVVALLVLIAVALAIYGPMLFRKKADEAKREIKAPTERVITAKGVVESEDEVDISSPVSATIREIRGDEGDSVKKGQSLVILDSDNAAARVRVAEAALGEARQRLKTRESGSRAEDIDMAHSRVKRAEAIYEQAAAELEKYKRLYEKDAVTLSELTKANERMNVTSQELSAAKAELLKLQNGVRKEEIAEDRAAVDKASAELKASRVALDDFVIRSPIDGIVIKRIKEAGEAVNVGASILRLVNPMKSRIRAELEESDVGRVAEGAAVEVTTDAYENRVYKGKVYKVLPTVQRRSQKTFDPVASFDVNAQDIYIHLDDFSGLKHGMSVTVRFLK